ncbi:MAG: dihydroorotase [Flavobacteriales bacterium]|nr:dihydroorotase [Flavobacteriales bacterium]
MGETLIKNVSIVNEGTVKICDVLISGEFILSIEAANSIGADSTTKIIDGTGKHLFPGLIDDQVHFREPGLTHKGDLHTESRAAVAGGVTSYMEMPNTVPNALSQTLLEEKYQRASEVSIANYSFFMGASNDNLEEVLKTDGKRVCGVKVFMGSSTGNMLVDNQKTLEGIFSECPLLIATHCEDEATIRNNMTKYAAEFGENLSAIHHPLIRNAEACYRSSSMSVELATKHNTRLHILHISTARETELFRNDIPLSEKRITAEACIHHLWFSDKDYVEKGNFIKWNPAIKSSNDREEIWKAVLDDRIDVIATDHAPHTIEEKEQSYTKAPSGGPLVQHSLLAMLEFYHNGRISLETITRKMSHAVADMFSIDKRGYIRSGYYADLVLADLNASQFVDRSSLLYKCGWSPFEGTTFKSSVQSTWVNGNLVWDNGSIVEGNLGQRLLFNR